MGSHIYTDLGMWLQVCAFCILSASSRLSCLWLLHPIFKQHKPIELFYFQYILEIHQRKLTVFLRPPPQSVIANVASLSLSWNMSNASVGGTSFAAAAAPQ
jgi:hypothetical protein